MNKQNHSPGTEKRAKKPKGMNTTKAKIKKQFRLLKGDIVNFTTVIHTHFDIKNYSTDIGKNHFAILTCATNIRKTPVNDINNNRDTCGWSTRVNTRSATADVDFTSLANTMWLNFRRLAANSYIRSQNQHAVTKLIEYERTAPHSGRIYWSTRIVGSR